MDIKQPRHKVNPTKSSSGTSRLINEEKAWSRFGCYEPPIIAGRSMTWRFGLNKEITRQEETSESCG
ncbi:hypothetical protein KFK09_014352 [Dendrobium nobile]|uniref:Uncharacterized protein n=1 Tax=Dendrobium nobile TaxID=94219 RepID=A0A8T3B9S9_DENNO|nr:hypothetical protein KFK09_014352 [Dendrobium nobile]